MKLYRKADEAFEFRIEQSRVVFLVVGVVLLAALVFLLGVLVGKTLWGGVPPPAAVTAPVSAPDATASTPEAPAVKKDFGFYDDVRRPEPETAARDPLREEQPKAESKPAAQPQEAPRAETKPAAKPAAAAPMFTVQVGSFKDRAAARALTGSLKSKGLPSELVRVSIEGQDWYRIHVGHFDTRAEAESYYRKTLVPKNVKGFVLAR